MCFVFIPYPPHDEHIAHWLIYTERYFLILQIKWASTCDHCQRTWCPRKGRGERNRRAGVMGSKHMSHSDDKHTIQLQCNTVHSPLMEAEWGTGRLMKFTDSREKSILPPRKAEPYLLPRASTGKCSCFWAQRQLLSWRSQDSIESN